MKKLIIFLLVVGVVVLAFVLMADQTSAPASPDNDQEATSSMTTDDSTEADTSTNEEEESSQSDSNSSKVVSVTYTDEGYSPSTVEVQQGDTITFINNSSRGMWTASALHPTHRVYSNTSLTEHCNGGTIDTFDACKDVMPGESWSFTFDKVGEWGYHNHTSPGDTGAVIVQ